MAKRKIEIQEPEVEVAQLIDLDENEKKPIWYRTGIWCTVTAIAGVAAAALYEIWKSSKESPAPAVDMFKAPTQPIIPHVEEPVTRAVEPVVEEAAESWQAARFESRDAQCLELSQVLYYVAVMMAEKGLTLEEVYAKL